MTASGGPAARSTQHRRLIWLRRGAGVVLAAGVLAFLVEGADTPPDPYLVPENSEAEAASDLGSRLGQDDPDASVGATTTSLALAGPPRAASDPGREATAAPEPRPGATPVPAAPPATAGTTPAPAPPPATPAPTAPASTASPRRPLPGFGEIEFRITGPSGTTGGVALLADDAASRSQGLMEQTDLRGYDAMVFRFPSPSAGRFFMRNTRIPLSIAFFDAGGRFVSAVDMEPCPDSVEDCPTYGAEAPYLHALEVLQGDLPRLGIGPGSVLSFP